MMNNGLPFFNMSSQFSPHSIANWYMEFLRSAIRSFSPFFHSTSNGTPPSIEPLSSLVEKSSRYMDVLNKVQNLLYRTSMTAWERVMESVASKTKEQKSPSSFEDFYNEWSAINEKAFVDLFNTEEYAQLQGELINLQSEMSRLYEKQVEAILQPYPLVLRSQLDEVYKQNHELRKKVNALEKQISDYFTSQKSKAPVQEGNTGAA